MESEPSAKLMYVFLSHKDILEVAKKSIFKMMSEIKCKDFVIVCGSKKTEYIENDKVLFINCNDNYEGQPEKVLGAMSFIIQSEIFSEYTHFLKIRSSVGIKKPIECLAFEKLNFAGNVTRKEGNRNWHIGQCSFESKFNFKPYNGKWIPWCPSHGNSAGNLGYLLSRKAIEVIKDKPVPEDQIYDDLCIAILLKEKGIEPTDFDLQKYLFKRDVQFEEYSNNTKTAIVMPIFNRYDCVKKCLSSLSKTDISNSILVMIDDGSTDIRVKKLIENFEMKTEYIHKIFKDQNVGMWDSYIIGFDWVAKNFPEAKRFVTLDSDTIHKQNWLMCTTELHDRFKNHVVTGFNTKTHAIAATQENYYEKSSAGGINFMFSQKTYFRNLREILVTTKNSWDNEFVGRCKKIGKKIFCTKPSVIQHIGYHGLNSNGKRWDHAFDFQEN